MRRSNVIWQPRRVRLKLYAKLPSAYVGQRKEIEDQNA
jgi:hypothetical protein